MAAYGTHNKSVVGSGKTGRSGIPCPDKSLATAQTYMVDLFPCNTVIVVAILAVKVHYLKRGSIYTKRPPFRKSRNIEELSSLDRDP